MTDAEFIDAMRTEAKAECARCRGVEHGDCDQACWYFVASGKASVVVPWDGRAKGKPWEGPVHVFSGVKFEESA